MRYIVPFMLSLLPLLTFGQNKYDEISNKYFTAKIPVEWKVRGSKDKFYNQHGHHEINGKEIYDLHTLFYKGTFPNDALLEFIVLEHPDGGIVTEKDAKEWLDYFGKGGRLGVFPLVWSRNSQLDCLEANTYKKDVSMSVDKSTGKVIQQSSTIKCYYFLKQKGEPVCIICFSLNGAAMDSPESKKMMEEIVNNWNPL